MTSPTGRRFRYPYDIAAVWDDLQDRGVFISDDIKQWVEQEMLPLLTDRDNALEDHLQVHLEGSSGVPVLIAASDASPVEKKAAAVVCDGVDDQVEINVILILLAAFGGTIQLSSGTFSISGSINLVDGATIRGMGGAGQVGDLSVTELVATAEDVTIFTAPSGAAHQCSFFDLGLRWAVNTASAATGWACVGQHNWRFIRCRSSMSPDGKTIAFSENATGPHISGCHFTGGEFQLHFSAAGHGPIRPVGLFDSKLEGAERALEGSFSGVVVGNAISGNRCIRFSAGAGATPSDSVVVGNYFRPTGVAAIENIAEGSLIAANRFIGNPSSYFMWIATDEVSIIGNYFTGTTPSAVEINNSASDCAVIGNDGFGTFSGGFLTDNGVNTRTSPTPAPTIAHAATTGQTTDDHHPKAHGHDGADGSGTVAHADTTGQTADDHHDEDHQARHQAAGDDALAGLLDANARIRTRLNGGADVGPRRRLNFVTDNTVDVALTDDAGSEEVDVDVGLSDDVIEILGHAIENGFENQTDSVLSFSDSGPDRTFQIAPAVTSFTFWSNKQKYTKSGSETIQIADTEGLHWIYYDGSGTLQETTAFSEATLVVNNALVAVVYWDVTNSEHVLFGDERHGRVMDSTVHGYLHTTRGTAWESGLSLGDILADESGDVDTHAQCSVADGVIRDEDIRLVIDDDDPQDLSPTAELPLFYRSGASGAWRKITATGFLATTTGSGRAAWNEDTGATWQLTEVGNTDFVLAHLIATNDVEEPVILIVGQAEYNTVGQARLGATDELTNLGLGALESGFTEWRALGTVILQSSNGYSNTVKSRVRSTDEGDDYIDWRTLGAFIGSGGSAGDHGALTGLGDDDHTIYLLRSILTTKGDIYVRNGSEAVRVGVSGNDGYVLTEDAAESAGVKWAAAGGLDELASLRDVFMFGGS